MAQAQANVITVEFEGASGATLSALLQMPPHGKPRGYALFAHCFTCTKDIFAARHLGACLAEQGIAVMRFDFTGLGESEGEFASTNFTSNVADLVSAAEYLEREHEAPRIMIGHSLGGAATLAAAPRVESAVAVCTIGAPAEPEHVQHLFTERSEEIKDKGEAEVLLAGRPFVIRRQFLEDIASVSLAGHIGELGKALLICHSPQDKTVGIDNARKIYYAAKHPKSFLSLDGADHLLSKRKDVEYAAGVISAWASRYIQKVTDEPAGQDGEPAEVIVSEAGGSGLAQLVVNGKHELVADEPVSLGGGNAGPTPYGLLLAALGSCTTMTLRLYARKKGLALHKVSVRLRHGRKHAQDCEQCADEGSGMEVIEKEITLQGEMDEGQRQRLLEIAERCPVHKSMAGNLQITTRLADD